MMLKPAEIWKQLEVNDKVSFQYEDDQVRHALMANQPHDHVGNESDEVKSVKAKPGRRLK
jgi:hypothetical protein